MFELIKMELPGCGDLPVQVTELWRELFGEEELRDTRGQFSGSEVKFYKDTIYAAVKDGKLAACCHITSQKNGMIAGLGGVASDNEFRGQGIADKVLAFALDDFDKSDCDAMFLGTGNPVAANLYAKYGFSYVRGTSAMLRVSKGVRFQDVLRREVLPDGEVCVRHGDASLRLPLIPLVYNGCGMLVCDANARIYGVNTFMQWSCMGLYPRYERIRENGGDFLMLASGSHCLGVASFVPFADMPGKAQGDIFYVAEASGYAPELLRKLRDAASAAEMELVIPVSSTDRGKHDLLVSSGAKAVGSSKLIPAKGVEITVEQFSW